MKAWPALSYAHWAPTKRTLHLVTQMLGKLRLALAPAQPNFIFTALYVTPRGVTTSAIPVGSRLIEAQLDVFVPQITIIASNGRRDIAFTELPTVAALYRAFLDALRALGVDVTLSPVPQEIPDTTPLDRDERPPAWAPEDARAWHALMSATQGIFDRWRAFFFGRSGIQLWWGALDLSLVLFTGKHVPPPLDRGYLFKYDLDAEMMNAGFYPGDDANEPFYYGYIYPEPDNCARIAVGPAQARWSEQFREWTLPYDVVRNSDEPEKLLRTFLDGIYKVCGDAAHWDRAAYTYVAPPLRHAR